jgi:hypothetical protein
MLSREKQATPRFLPAAGLSLRLLNITPKTLKKRACAHTSAKSIEIQIKSLPQKHSPHD